jgi:hypothetical protein
VKVDFRELGLNQEESKKESDKASEVFTIKDEPN